MIIFLFGSDTYRLHQKLREIIEKYKKTSQGGVNLKFYEGKNLNFKELLEEIRQNSMFNKRKLLILQDVFNNSSFKEKFLKNHQPFIESKDIILFYKEGEISQKDGFFNFLKKKSKFQEFKPLEGRELKRWVQKEFEKYKTRIKDSALERLITYIGNDLWQLSNEIKKIASYKKEGVIGEREVELLVTPKIEINIFQTIDSLASKDKKRALKLLHQHLEKGEHPLYLLSMINFQFRNLLIIKDLVERNVPFYLLSQKTGLPHYVIRKSLSQSQKFTMERLKSIYRKILQLELKVKKGKISSTLALESLVVEI